MESRTDGSTNMDAYLEANLRQMASGLRYPPTPDLAARSAPRRLSRRRGRVSFALAIVLILLLTALWVSPVRARVLDWIRIGAVRIFFSVPVPTPPATPGAQVTVTPTPLQSVLDIAGETSLSAAREQAGFPILLPGFPDDLGPPDAVFLQEFANTVVVLVWMHPDAPGQVRMSLSQAFSNVPIFEKYSANHVENTQVGDYPAVWMDGDYLLVERNGEASMTRLIDQSHTLIWDTGEQTFRLETEVDLATALRIAGSLR